MFIKIKWILDALGCLVYEEGDESFNGNQGIKDQQLALQWVQDNIESFGGDKNEVKLDEVCVNQSFGVLNFTGFFR